MDNTHSKALYSNSEIRTLTLEGGATNQAHEIWYSHLTPLQRVTVAENIDPSLSIEKRLNACLNYIEDNLTHFKEVLMRNEVSALISTSVSDAKISLDNVLNKDPEEAKRLAESLLKKIGTASGQASRKKMAETIIRKANKALKN
ncbi:hypothetical protein [Vibrio europaeus]|uniref:hypothetical protein n=1 Tax=Vibrio europaeus TaxID=300876 RepID=UPI00233ECEA2|nr:hypothetical protein [Vibrio europaeus]MDC5753594.1 hypothetical protein [Vibrio europaeus]MDC5816493.1 hypothetical protein [Vibrio europaeus]